MTPSAVADVDRRTVLRPRSIESRPAWWESAGPAGPREEDVVILGYD